MSFPSYPRYKSSGVEWLNDVPDHWSTAPLYSVAGERNEPNEGMIEDNLLSLSYGRIISKDISSNDGLLPESFETYQVVRSGDIVLRLTDLQNDKRSLRSGVVREKGIITSAYVALNPTGITSAYLGYLMRAYDLTKVFYSMGGGLRQSMKFADLKRLPVLVPPESEQLAISSFLDRETAKIDALVGEQQRLIDLLEEKRQAVVTQAVTKGLDPTLPMKSSEVNWLGDVPAHWRVIPLRWFATCSSGEGISGELVDSDPSLGRSIPVVGGNGVMGYTSSANVLHGALAVGRVGALCGNVHLINQPAWITDNALVVKIDEDTYDLSYLGLALRSRNLNVIASKTAQPLITGTQVRDQRLPCPPMNEQIQIVRSLGELVERFDLLQSEAEAAVRLLRERRNALISAAVGGEIDVRGAATEAVAA